jgi:hypothetical protein
MAEEDLTGLGKPPDRKAFVPEEWNLSADFLLTNFSDLKG